MKKLFKICLNALPVVVMVALIPHIPNDYLLTFVYVVIIFVALSVHRTQNDMLMLVFGFFAMTILEYFFIKTGVKTFSRRSLFGIMPLWLPFLWAYGFVAIKHAVEILNKGFQSSHSNKKMPKRRSMRRDV